ncbi:hypothetical protein, partial [Paracoccus sp. IB05]|uniref:hypothetical protein n=1 Tax=Paracoccus sp. IB05 TaxID=2779367 RepID=UPI001E5519DB
MQSAPGKGRNASRDRPGFRHHIATGRFPAFPWQGTCSKQPATKNTIPHGPTETSMTAQTRDSGFFTESLSSRDPELFGA